jgi:hypothetical protein
MTTQEIQAILTEYAHATQIEFMDGQTVRDLASDCLTLRTQRDELLKACREAARKIADNYCDTDEHTDALMILRGAIMQSDSSLRPDPVREAAPATQKALKTIADIANDHIKGGDEGDWFTIEAEARAALEKCK